MDNFPKLETGSTTEEKGRKLGNLRGIIAATLCSGLLVAGADLSKVSSNTESSVIDKGNVSIFSKDGKTPSWVTKQVDTEGNVTWPRTDKNGNIVSSTVQTNENKGLLTKDGKTPLWVAKQVDSNGNVTWPRTDKNGNIVNTETAKK